MKRRIDELDGKEVSDTQDPTAYVAVTRQDLEHAVKLIETTAFDLGKFPGDTILKIVAEGKAIGEVCLPEDVDICKWYLRKFYWMLSVRKGV
jgi:hypothetical protein